MKKTTAHQKPKKSLKPITKDELNIVKQDIIYQITQNVNEYITSVFDKKLTLFKDQIITLLDKVLGELKAIREEQSVISGKLS